MTANAGYHAYATGDVLTAAQVQYNLQNQTTMYFASSAARTTALSGVLVEGMVSYIPANGIEYYNGSAWVSISQAVTALTTKGDLLTYSTQDTRLPVGSDGQTLVANSANATGLGWQGSYPAGKNLLINGLLDIWQRATTVTFSSNGYNAQDRWYNYAAASSTFARESSIVPTGCVYSCKITVGASASAVQSEQAIETLNAAPYAGSTMTLSGHFQSSATPTITYVVYYSTATDVAVGGTWTAITATSGGSGTAGASSFTRISGVYAIPSTAKSLKVVWYSTSIAAAGVLYWGGMQFEAGSVPTTLVRNASTLQGELAACQRYYFQKAAGGTNNSVAGGAYYTTTNMSAVIAFPVSMRVSPTISQITGTNYYGFVANGGIDSFNSLTIDATGLTQVTCYNNTEMSGTAGFGGNIVIQNASGSLAFSAEL